jgi:hypothetical protein
METKTYTISPRGISKQRERFLLQSSIIYGVIFLIIFGRDLVANPDNTITSIIIPMVLLSVVLTYSLWRGWRQNKEILESIRIKINDEYIARSQVRIPQILINRQEVTSIEEIGAGLCIRSADKTTSLLIPNNLDESDYQEIKNILSYWSTIHPQSPKTKILSITLVVVLITAFSIIFFSSSLWLGLIAGLFLLVYYGYYYWSLRQTKAVDPRYMRAILIGLIISLLMVISRVVILLKLAP